MSNDAVSKRQALLLLTWLIALTALVGTLYASEIRDIAVCHLCWYQRICLYPLVVILGIAAYRDDSAAIRYVLPLTGFGFVFALYQYLEQMIPGFAPIEVCNNGPSCSEMHLQLLGFISFPLLSMLACVIITILLIAASR